MSSTKLLLGDCLEVMPSIPDGSCDMVLVDPPYGTTRNRWDSVIPLDDMWVELNRVCKLNAAMAFTSAEPFTSNLILSNVRNFRYDLIWEKTVASGQLNVNRMPLRTHENIVVFYRKLPTYNEQKTIGEPYKIKRAADYNDGCYNKQKPSEKENTGYRHARSVIKMSNPRVKGGHPTQKPVELMELLISMYTNEDETVLDFAMGSGTTGVACATLNRNFIGIEKDEGWFEKTKGRLGYGIS